MTVIENRNYSRVNVLLRGHARFIQSAEAPPLFRGGFTLPESHSPSDAKSGTPLPDALVTFLEGIDTKLNMILTSISQDKLLADFSIRLSITELSGAGIRFTSDTDLNIGQHLEIVMIFSQFPLRMVGILGTIQRKDIVDNAPCYAFCFSQVREMDREAIVQFVFQEQRERIREQKNEL